MTELEQAPTVRAATRRSVPIRLIFMATSKFLEDFGIGFINTEYIYFMFVKLGIYAKSILFLEAVFQTLGNFLLPIGGVFANIIKNKFYLIALSNCMRSIALILFIILAVPSFRLFKWPLLYIKETINMIADVIGLSASSAFIMDQFDYPRENALLRKYSQFTSVAEYTADLLAMLMSPFLKTRIACLGEQDCFLIPFALCFFLVALSHIVTYTGYRYYRIKKPIAESIKNVMPCIWYGLIHSIRERNTDPRDHWMDHAASTYGDELVHEAKALLRVLFVDIIQPVLIAIDRNVLIAKKIIILRLRLQIDAYKMFPEHMDLLQTAMGHIIFPLLIVFAEPWIKKVKFDKPLRRWIIGLLLMSATEGCYGLLSAKILNSLPTFPQKGEAQLRIFNEACCPAVIVSSKFLNESVQVEAHGQYSNLHIPMKGYSSFHFTVTGSCFQTAHGESYLGETLPTSVYLNYEDEKVEIINYKEIIFVIPEISYPILTVLGADMADPIFVEDSKGSRISMLPKVIEVAGKKIATNGPRKIVLEPGWYKVYRRGRLVFQFDADLGGVYHVVISEHSAKLTVTAKPNSICFAWILPIFIIEIIAGYLINLATIEFRYPETPRSLRSLSASLHYVISGFGYMLIPLFETNLLLNFRLYLYALIRLIMTGLFLLISLNIRSRHEGRALF